MMASTEEAGVADAPTSALASAEPPEPNLQEECVDSIVAAAVAAAEAELQAVEEGAAPAVPGAERESKLATFEEEDIAASLMSNPTSERSGVALTNWERFARPVELAILSLVMLLLVVGRSGLDWARVGAGVSGLRACVRLEPPRPRCALSRALSTSAFCHTGSAQASSGHAFLPLHSSCAPGAEAAAFCALEGAGAWALGLSGAALLASVLLGAATATQELHRRGKLGPVAEGLAIPAATFERAMLLTPPLLWALLLLLLFLTLLVYAARAPSDEHGTVQLGLSYGCARLALLLGAAGAGLHAAFQHGVAHDEIIDALDTLASAWSHLARVQRACLIALLGGTACELLLWVQREGWSWILLLFGARAVTRRARGQLAAYQCAAVLAACTDALALASVTDELCVTLRWLTLLSKLASVGLLAFYPTAFS